MPITNDVQLGRDVRIFHPDLVNLYGCSIGDETRIDAVIREELLEIKSIYGKNDDRRTEITSELVEGFASDERARRHVEDAVFGIELRDRGAAPLRIALAEDFLKIAMKQFVDTVTHNTSP